MYLPKHLMIYAESLIAIFTILCSICHLNQINRCRRRKLLYDLPRCKLPFPLSASRNIEKVASYICVSKYPACYFFYVSAISIFLRYLSSCLFQCLQFTSLPESEFFFRIVKHVTSFDAHNVNSADDNF